ncbi:MAG: flavin reductase family protein [Candidatus Brocadiia bacterium]
MRKKLGPTSYMFPMPCVLVSSGKTLKEANFATIAYTGVVNGQPPMVYASLRPSRLTHSLVKSSGAFGLCIPTLELLAVTDAAGIVSGREVNKFEKFGLTPFLGEKTGVAMIRECPVCLECKVVNSVDLPTHTVFIGEVKETYVIAGLLDADDRIRFEVARFFGYGASAYWAVGEKVAEHGFSKDISG